MNITLGASITANAVHVVLVDGANADGVILDEAHADLTSPGAEAHQAADTAVSMILTARDTATAAGHQPPTVALTWSQPIDPDALTAALSACGIGEVTVVAVLRS